MNTNIYPGKPYPLGATWDGEGVNFALYAENANGVDLCLFETTASEVESVKIRIKEVSHRVWHVYVPGLKPGQLYGYRVYGPYEPQNGQNINYYDDKELLSTVTPFIIDNITRLVSYQSNHDTCFCIGGEKNFRFLSSLNEKHKWFKKIEPLPHPRFIMQYRRKQKEQFILQYLQLITK